MHRDVQWARNFVQTVIKTWDVFQSFMKVTQIFLSIYFWQLGKTKTEVELTNI